MTRERHWRALKVIIFKLWTDKTQSDTDSQSDNTKMYSRSGLLILMFLPAFHCILLEMILIASQLGLSKIAEEAYKSRFKLDNCTLSYEKPYLQFKTKKQLFNSGIYFNKTNGELLDKIFKEGRIIRKDENDCYKAVRDNSSDDILTFGSLLQLHEANIFLFKGLEETLHHYFEHEGTFQLSMVEVRKVKAYWNNQPLSKTDKEDAIKYAIKRMIWNSIFPPEKHAVSN